MKEEDITLHLYDDNFSFVTIEDMQELLRKQQTLDPEAGEDTIDCELSRMNEDELYDSSYFWNYEPELLCMHLLAEQCFEHFDEVSWETLTNGYDERIIRTIDYAIHHPLVWCNIRPDNGTALVDGRMAIEMTSEARLSDKPYASFLKKMHEKRLVWFADNLPTRNNIILPDDTINLPEKMPLWYLITTDYSEETDSPLVPSWVKNNVNEQTDEQETIQKNTLFSPKALQQNFELIAKECGGARAAYLVDKLREDWKKIKFLQLFDVNKLTKEEKDNFDECLNDGLNYYLEQWEKDSLPANTSATNGRPERFKDDPDSSFFIITKDHPYEVCRGQLMDTLTTQTKKSNVCRILESSHKRQFFALKDENDGKKAELINPWVKLAGREKELGLFRDNDFSKARNS